MQVRVRGLAASGRGGALTWVNFIVEFLPLVHPDLGEARVVVVDDFARSPGERVRRRFAENVAHVRTRDYEQRALTHPHLHEPHGTATAWRSEQTRALV